VVGSVAVLTGVGTASRFARAHRRGQNRKKCNLFFSNSTLLCSPEYPIAAGEVVEDEVKGQSINAVKSTLS
jgi:hypothetical protein